MRSWASEGRWKRRWTRCWIEWRERGASVRAPSALIGWLLTQSSLHNPSHHPYSGGDPLPRPSCRPSSLITLPPIIWLVDGLDLIWISVSFFLGRSGPSLPADLLNPAHPLNWFFVCRSDEIWFTMSDYSHFSFFLK